MQARINRDRCSETDKYSIKCWSYTEATFPIIPDNVLKWFVVNCDIDDERVVAIPFGVYGNKDDLSHVELIKKYQNIDRQREKLLYVNFQFYTTDRVKLYHTVKNTFDPQYVTFKNNVPFEEYLYDLGTHKYVLCPSGNGYDCYRTLETIYMGAIPILQRIVGSLLPYVNIKYPMITYYDLYRIEPEVLIATYSTLEYKQQHKDLTTVYWKYWKNYILGVWDDYKNT